MIGIYWEEPKFKKSQTSNGVIHFCRQIFQYLIQTMVDPKRSDFHPINLSIDSGIIEGHLKEIYDALTCGLALPL